MAIPTALNRDPFLAGVMDAPDPVVRSAMAKVMNPQGLPPMTQKELDRLLNRQFLEQQQVKQANAYQGRQLYEARQEIASGRMPEIDVKSYSGSMFAAPGSYTDARPIAQRQQPMVRMPSEFAIRNIPGRGESTVVRGTEIKGGPATSGMQALTVPEAGYGYVQGTADYLSTTPYGTMRGFAPALGATDVKYRTTELAPDQQQRVSQMAGEMLSSTEAAPIPAPVAPMPTGARPSTQPAIPQVPTARPASFGPALDQLMGASALASPPSLAPKPLTQMAASDVFSFTPDALARAAQDREFGRRQAEDQRKIIEEKAKKDIAAARASFAVGQPLPAGIQLTAPQIYEAYIGGMDDRKRGLTTVRVDKEVGGKMVPYEITTNPLTGERYESQIQRPVLSVQELADLENKKQMMALGVDDIKKVDLELQFARKQAELANQITNAIAQGVTTGPLAEVSAGFKSIGEALLDNEYGATAQKLYIQAVQGMSLNQITNVMRGLGAMSDEDRKAAQKAFVSVRDPKLAVLYYAELSRLNYERAQARQALIDSLTESGATSDKIRVELSKMKRNEPFLSEVAFKNLKLDRVVSNQTSGGMTRLPASPRGNVKPNTGVEGFIIIDEQP